MFDLVSYFPALTTRAGELAAYQQSLSAVRDALVPIFTLTRYAETKSLADSAAALIDALEGRPAIVDFDIRPRPVTSLAEAEERRRRTNLRRVQAGQNASRPRSDRQLAGDAERLRRTEAFNRELASLVEPSQGPRRWLELLHELPELVPVLRMVDARNLRQQLELMGGAGRAAAIKIRATEAYETSMVLECADLISSSAERLVLIVDVGNVWGRVDGSVMNVLDVLRRLQADIEGFDHLTMVVLSTAFPRQPLRSMPSALPISDLDIHRRISEEFQIRLGDYGSLPNRTEDTIARGWFPHVDLVTPDHWHVALYENNRDASKYVDASRDIVGDTVRWRRRAQCWGTSIIEQVALGDQIIDGKSFTHPSPWLTVRINQHLSQMALRTR
jgi:hypothetical protein